mmetsp:Transcript_13426/g.32815  ORF Transcript_13426/g.32815 Transcript_13426/m.32815 type:complete len:281 (-) Transcript_13426:612-1454(-)
MWKGAASCPPPTTVLHRILAFSLRSHMNAVDRSHVLVLGATRVHHGAATTATSCTSRGPVGAAVGHGSHDLDLLPGDGVLPALVAAQVLGRLLLHKAQLHGVPAAQSSQGQGAKAHAHHGPHQLHHGVSQLRLDGGQHVAQARAGVPLAPARARRVPQLGVHLGGQLAHVEAHVHGGGVRQQQQHLRRQQQALGPPVGSQQPQGGSNRAHQAHGEGVRGPLGAQDDARHLARQAHAVVRQVHGPRGQRHAREGRPAQRALRGQLVRLVLNPGRGAAAQAG